MEEIIATFDSYVIYKYTNENIGSYYLCKPTGKVLEYTMFLGFPNGELREISNEEIIDDIKKVADAVVSLNSNGIYLLPIIPYNELVDASLENDFRTDRFGNVNYNSGMFARIYENKVKPITMDVYRLLDGKINRKISMIKKDKPDRMFIHWMVMDYTNKYGNNASELLEEIEYRDLVNTNKQKPLFSNEFMGIPPTSTDTSEGGIAPVNHEFDNINSMSNAYTKVLKPKSSSSGFSNINFIIITLLLSLVVGVSIGYLLMK